MLLTKTVENIGIPTEWMKNINNEELTLQILKAIYSENIQFAPFTENANICYWINDEKKAMNMFHKNNSLMHAKRHLAIVSCDDQVDIPIKDNLEIYHIKNEAIGILVLGYFHFYLKRFPYPEIFYLYNNERSLNLYRQLLDTYSLSYVSKNTGLCKEDIVRIYKYLFMYKPHHHLLLKDEWNEKNIQCIRSISFLPLFQQPYHRENMNIPLSYDYMFSNIRVKIKKQQNKVMKQSILDVTPLCPNKLEDICEDTSINLYDIDFAEAFNVDPFPLHSTSL